MNREEAAGLIPQIVGEHVAPLITQIDIDLALDRSKTLDAAYRTPSDPGYVESYDPHWAAAEAVTSLAIRQVGGQQLSKFTSEGATFEVAPPNLLLMAAMIRQNSPIATIAAEAIGMIEVGVDVGYDPTSKGWPA